MAKKHLSHYSPIFANKKWAQDDIYISYYKCIHSSSVKKSDKGYKQWGRKRNLYSKDVEKSLDKNLENDVGPIYEKIVNIQEPTYDEKTIWSQFLLSQLVRTPTFIKYEKRSPIIFSSIQKPMNDRVGCKHCLDLNYIVNRDWCLLVAHEDDFFIRTDNPVLQTGFIQRSDTCLFYPLTPRLCFAACSMSEKWNAFKDNPNELYGRILGKGTAIMINFHLAKSAGETFIVHPKHENSLLEKKFLEKMFMDYIGIYPQPPFSLIHYHDELEEENQIDSYESIRLLMSITDEINYPAWRPFELEPWPLRKRPVTAE